MLKIEIKTGGAAFRDLNGEENAEWKAAECRRLLDKISGELDAGKTYGSIMDINGNKVGKWEVD